MAGTQQGDRPTMEILTLCTRTVAYPVTIKALQNGECISGQVKHVKMAASILQSSAHFSHTIYAILYLQGIELQLHSQP